MTEQAQELHIRKWYVMAAYKLELKTETSLLDAGLEVFLPKQTVYVKQPHRRPKPVERPAIPSLIFVNATRQQLLDFKRRNDDRIKFQMTPVGGALDYLTVPDRQMSDFIHLWTTRDTCNATLSTDPIPPGTPVRIISGPMAGLTGTFIRHLKRRTPGPLPESSASLSSASQETLPPAEVTDSATPLSSDNPLTSSTPTTLTTPTTTPLTVSGPTDMSRISLRLANLLSITLDIPTSNLQHCR